MVRRSAGTEGEERGTLFIVATPIGNLADMTQRAIDTLRSVDLVLAEDTRKTRVLLDHFGIRTRLRAAHAHNEAATIPVVLDELRKKKNVALVTDAGTPLISDPGSRLVQAVRDAGLRVSPIPGASALTAALSAAGLDTTRFTFFGFLPRAGRERTEALDSIATITHTVVLYESPNRLSDTLSDLARSSPDRSCVIAREITKLFEEFRSGTVEELSAYYADSPARGEVVILLSGATPKSFSQQELENRVKALREAGTSARDAAAQIAAETGVPRNVVYRIAVKT